MARFGEPIITNSMFCAVSSSPMTALFTSYQHAKEYLFGLKGRGSTYGIDRMVALSDVMGHPERRIPMIHVAGTNGKGSTAATLESIYRSAGYRTGLFTSPHLVHQGERIQVNRKPLSNEAILNYTNRLRPLALKLAEQNPALHPSFFEFMTAMAFDHFLNEAVDIAIIEVGLGGRLDATNIILPELSIITSISLDHCRILGESLEQIAFEKAGIIKPGRPVVLGNLPAVAEQRIRDIAASRGASVSTIAERFGVDLNAPSYPRNALEGNYQRWNAASAVLAIELLRHRFPVSDEALRTGLNEVEWSGRWERRRVDQGKLLILDASHNPEGSAMLADNLERLHAETGKRPIFITGSLGEARATALYPVVARFAREIYLARPAQTRASPFEVLEAAIPRSFTGAIHRSSVKELFPLPGVCAVGEPDDVIVCTGSIYLLGEILEALDYPAPVAEQSLQD